MPVPQGLMPARCERMLFLSGRLALPLVSVLSLLTVFVNTALWVELTSLRWEPPGGGRWQLLATTAAAIVGPLLVGWGSVIALERPEASRTARSAAGLAFAGVASLLPLMVVVSVGSVLS